MSKHTAGPWRYKEWGGLIVGGGTGSDEILICTMAVNTRHDEGRCNRELILAAPTMQAAITAERERADRAEAELGQWKQAAELARDDHQHEYGRANALEMCVDRLESELMAAQVEARLWNEAVKDRRVLPIGSYYGPDDKVPVRQP